MSLVPIICFWWVLVLYEWRSMDKTQYMNDVQHRTGQEMHREVRATTNFSQWIEFKCEQREDLVRKVNKAAMSIRLSSSVEKKKSDSISLLSSISRHRNMSKQHSHNNTMIKPTSPCNYNNLTGSSMPEPFSIRGNKVTKNLTKIGHNSTIIKHTLQ